MTNKVINILEDFENKKINKEECLNNIINYFLTLIPSYIDSIDESIKYGRMMNEKSDEYNGMHQINFENGCIYLKQEIENKIKKLYSENKSQNSVQEWIKEYFKEQWEEITDTDTDIDFKLYIPISTSNSLHIYEERYLINDITYRLLYEIGGDVPTIEKLKQ